MIKILPVPASTAESPEKITDVLIQDNCSLCRISNLGHPIHEAGMAITVQKCSVIMNCRME
jgi:hypothetical protein